ncbi:MAG: efflux RND transporter periplasmic adaptor subunit, partial [Gammaproteobacteria bacterium]|nr:efflux RND transporter periplasmic adaptor subunit [Gammaproteobacteria bacterium]
GFVGVSGSDEPDVTRPAAATPIVQAAAIAARPTSESVLDATGYVVARRSATVSAKTTGKVMQVMIEEGMRVSAGQVMARLDDSTARAQLNLAEAQVQAARALTAELDAKIVRAQQMLARWSQLAVKGLASESRLDDLKTDLASLLARQTRAHLDAEVALRRAAVQRTQLADFLIRAPFDGVVISKSAQPGEMISPLSAGGGFTRTGIGTIVDMGSLEVEVDVNEAYINRVSPGQRTHIQLNAYPDKAYPGQVLAVIPTANRSKATVRVRIGFAETDDRILPEMGVKVAFIDASRADY